MKAEKAEIVRTTIDLPFELNRKLVREAKRTKRSRHARMLFALERFFDESTTGNGEKEKSK